jgi:DNA modification methylase
MTILKDVRIGNQRLILGDCLQVMPLLGKVDAVVTDPPFGIKMDRGVGTGGFSGFGDGARRERHVNRYAGGWDGDRPPEAAFDMLLDAAESHIVWGGQFFADVLPPQGKWLFWDKIQTMPSFGDGELAWTSIPGAAVKQFTYNGSGLHAKEKNRVHPTQKPVALMEWCLGFLPNAKTILDPFMGSGTTLVACQRMGRHGVGIELDPDYFEIACKRVDEAARQPDLLIPETRAAPIQEQLL